MIKRKSDKKGFTIMEMLIVVAIIAVLAAIAIPTFNGALTKSKEAADVANVRAAYAAMQVAILTDDAQIPTNAITATKTKTTVGGVSAPITDYLSGDLNYEKLTYAYNGGDKKGTITYTPAKLTGGNGSAVSGDVKTFVWTIKAADIK